MAVLTVDVGGSPLSLNCTRGGHAAPRRVGPKTIGNIGTEESSVRAELMVVPIITDPILLATAATLRTKFAIGNQVPCEGDIFNTPGTITCSGQITDELRETADSVILNLTLFEVGTTLTYTPIAAASLYLTNDVSPVDGSMNLASADPSDDSVAFGSLTVPSGVTIPTCGGAPDPSVTCATATSPAAEAVWLLAGAAADGWITGSPTVVMHSSGGTGDHWALQDCMCKIFIVRAGVDVVEWDTGWSNGNGGFSGGDITMVAPAVVFHALTGDRVRVELYARAARHGGYSTTDLQVVSFGQNGSSHWAILYLGGDASTLLWPAP